MSQLDRRLSTISVTRLAKTPGTKKNESEKRIVDISLPSDSGSDSDSEIEEEKVSCSNVEAVSQTSNEPTDDGKTRERETEQLPEEEECDSRDMDGVAFSNNKGQRSAGRFTRRESLLERKKRDYFKFTLIPTCGVQFNESCDSRQENKEVLI